MNVLTGSPHLSEVICGEGTDKLGARGQSAPLPLELRGSRYAALEYSTNGSSHLMARRYCPLSFGLSSRCLSERSTNLLPTLLQLWVEPVRQRINSKAYPLGIDALSCFQGVFVSFARFLPSTNFCITHFFHHTRRSAESTSSALTRDSHAASHGHLRLLPQKALMYGSRAEHQYTRCGNWSPGGPTLGTFFWPRAQSLIPLAAVMTRTTSRSSHSGSLSGPARRPIDASSFSALRSTPNHRSRSRAVNLGGRHAQPRCARHRWRRKSVSPPMSAKLSRIVGKALFFAAEPPSMVLDARERTISHDSRLGHWGIFDSDPLTIFDFEAGIGMRGLKALWGYHSTKAWLCPS